MTVTNTADDNKVRRVGDQNDRELNRFQFFEFLIRLAMDKYLVSQKVKTASEAVEMLMENLMTC
jgi:hypothetical protein